MSDSFHRPINYLRISVTDRCNLRCIYCMPHEGIRLLSHGDVLSYEEVCLIAKAAAEVGITKVRITGGEPLVRAHLSSLIRMLSEIEGIDDLSLTTNGILLSSYAQELKEAGLKRVNVSLDTLRPERFEKITRVGKLEDTLRGILSAQAAGLRPVKINMVVMRGINDDELVDFARATIEQEWHIRFIEFMPVGEQAPKWESWFMPVSDIMERISVLGPLDPHLLAGNGPAKYFSFPQAKGTIGFISAVSEHFCFKCNRLRLTADGKLRPCLLSDGEIDLREPLRRGASLEEIKGLMKQAIAAKPEGHKLEVGTTARNRNMCQIGG
ncbi:MAG: GTP 3',8-cyclase MoaA [Dehalococcoidia bacterium]|nr:GTP 3',8-cyclase MoaA [Dehalococcoidia bacterium]